MSARLALCCAGLVWLQGCAVIAVADATVTVAATAVKAGAAVTGMAGAVGAAGGGAGAPAGKESRRRMGAVGAGSTATRLDSALTAEQASACHTT